MNKIKIEILENQIEVIINTYKLCLGRNYKLKYMLKNAIKQYFEKVPLSEYYKINNSQNLFEFNEKRVDIKGWQLFEINSNFDLNIDLKLTSKSIVLKYFETILQDIEYDDNVSTINMLLTDLNNNIIMNRISQSSEGLSLKVNIQDLNFKTICKLLEASLEKDDLEANGYDLTYDESIIFQIDMIEQISFKTLNKNTLTIIDIPQITKKIMRRLECIEDTYVLVFSDSIDYDDEIKIDNVCYFNNTITDFAQNEIIYNNIIMNLPFNLSVDDVKTEVNKLIQNTFTEKNRIIFKLI